MKGLRLSRKNGTAQAWSHTFLINRLSSFSRKKTENKHLKLSSPGKHYGAPKRCNYFYSSRRKEMSVLPQLSHFLVHERLAEAVVWESAISSQLCRSDGTSCSTLLQRAIDCLKSIDGQLHQKYLPSALRRQRRLHLLLCPGMRIIRLHHYHSDTRYREREREMMKWTMTGRH